MMAHPSENDVVLPTDALGRLTMSEIDVYQYSGDECYGDLVNGVAATRLVELLPGTWDDRLQCHLRSVRLDKMPSYQALSYAWHADPDEGVPGPTQLLDPVPSQAMVLVNDSWCLPVNSGLEQALLAIRKPDVALTLWVDQLSIDQCDNHEKSSQVAQMALIYGQADSVILWTGKKDRSSEAAFQSILLLADIWIEFGSVSPDGAVVEDQFIVRHKDEETRIWTPLVLEFLLRRVFTRGWILQEIALAKEVVVWCGDRQEPWDTIAAAILAMDAIGRREGNDAFVLERDGEDRTTPVLSTVKLRQKVQAHGPVTLSEALEALYDFETTDPRDKVFAALGMCRLTSDIQKILPINYDLPLSDVFLRATKAIVFGERTFIPLTNAGLNRTPGRPSWVADWSIPRTRRRAMHIARERGFAILNDLPPMTCWPVPNNDSPERPMAVTSRRFGTIRHVEGRAAVKGTVGSYNSTLISWIKLAVDHSTVYGSVPATHMAVFRTLIYPFPIVWRSEGPVVGKDVEELRMPGLEDAPSASGGHPEYEINVLQVALQNVLNLDDEQFFYDFKVVGPEGRDRPVFYAWEDGQLVQAKTLSNGDQIITLAQLADGFFVFRGDVGAMFKTLHKAFDDHHALFVTDNGYIGLGPDELCVGDEIHLVWGADVPMAFRREDTDDITITKRQFLSECYVHGIMHGEALESRGELGLITIY